MSRSQSRVGVLAPAMLVAMACAMTAIPVARADMYTTEGPLCQYIADAGHRAMKAKDYRKAVASFTKAIEWTAKNCGTDDWKFYGLYNHYMFRARAYAALNDFERAAKDLMALMEQDGLRLFRNDDVVWVFAAVNGAVKANPKDPSLRGLRAGVYDWYITYASKGAGGLTEEAAFKARLADRNAQIELAKSNVEKAEAFAKRSVIYEYQEKKPALALEDISEAIKLDPQASYYRRRAEYLERAKPPNFKMALADLSEAVAVAPDKTRWLALKARAKLYERAGQYDKAIDDLTEASKTEPGILKDRAKLLRKANRLDEASSEYSKLASKSPKDARLRAEWLLVLLAQGDDKGAERLRKRIEKLDPKVLGQSWFVCERAGGEWGTAGKPKGPEAAALREAWSMGQVVALTPLQHLIGKPNPTADKAWGMTSSL